MAEYKLVLPSLGEGVLEATLISWLKQEGETIEEDDSIIEIATDKVDSDVPSPVSGVLSQKLFNENEVIQVGEVFAIIETDQVLTYDAGSTEEITSDVAPEVTQPEPEIIAEVSKPISQPQTSSINYGESNGFLSPLVKTIIEKENLSMQEINQLQGTGKEGRITKEDVMKLVESKKGTSQSNSISTPSDQIQKEVSPNPVETAQAQVQAPTPKAAAQAQTQTSSAGIAATPTVPTGEKVVSNNDNVEIIEMDRMRKLIAEHMVNSKHISPHVTSFIESDVTPVVQWRNKNKEQFQKREGEKLTFMPIFVWAVAKAIKDFPMINVSVDGDKIIRKKNINIGMATALPSGNLIVPVIKNADKYNIAGLAKCINDLAYRARNNQLKPDEVKGGTYTITNLGTFGNIMGTPIINQPEVAILAVGAIEKKPSVIETESGDLIGIRHKMFMSHAYDHRVVDGALGGMFLQRVSQYLENFEMDTEV